MLGNRITSRISIFDVVLVLGFLMMWFFVVQVWGNKLGGVMLSITTLLVGVYLLARFTGFLSFLELSKPFWTLSALVSFFIWKALFAILPSPQVSSVESEILSGNILSLFLNATQINQLLQVVLFAGTESLFVLFLVTIFIRFTLQRGGQVKLGQIKTSNARLLIPIVMVAAFAALIHTAVAVKMAAEGAFSFSVVILHQFLSFFIMIILAMFMGAPALIAPHIVKNMIVFGTPGGWFILFAVFIIIDIMSVILAKPKEQKLYSNSVSRFT